MDTIERIPEAELEVMLTLWHSGAPLTVGEIAKLLAARFIKEVYHPEWLVILFLYEKRMGNGGCVLITQA